MCSAVIDKNQYKNEKSSYSLDTLLRERKFFFPFILICKYVTIFFFSGSLEIHLELQGNVKTSYKVTLPLNQFLSFPLKWSQLLKSFAAFSAFSLVSELATLWSLHVASSAILAMPLSDLIIHLREHVFKSK